MANIELADPCPDCGAKRWKKCADRYTGAEKRSCDGRLKLAGDQLAAAAPRVPSPALSAEDLAKHVDRVAEAVGSADLQGLVRRISDTVPKKRTRVALPLVQPENPSGSIALQPYVTFQPTHIVLTDDAARAFELVQWQLCNVSQLITNSPLPLDLFSIKHMVNDQLAMVNEWTNAPRLTPANRLVMYVQRRNPCPIPFDTYVEFRGLLWGYYEELGY